MSVQLDHITVYKNTNGDSRVAKIEPTIEAFQEANKDHIVDVTALMKQVCIQLEEQARHHDWTKCEEPYQTMFYRDLCSAVTDHTNFVEGEWYKAHITEERHHLNSRVPDDVNLFDVLEMLVDCCVAGKARNAENVYAPSLSDDVLQKAFQNTFDILCDAVDVR